MSDGQIRFIGLSSMLVGLLLAALGACVRCVSGSFPSTSRTSCRPRPAHRARCAARILDLFRDARLRAGAAAAARVPRFAAHRHRARPRPADLQGRRPALGPHAGRARRHHAAGGAHRRAPAQPQGRDAPVLLRQRAAHAPRRRPARRASRSRSAPSSTARPASTATSRCSALLCRRSRVAGARDARIDLGHVAVFRAHCARAPAFGGELEAELFEALAAQGRARACTS